MATSSRPRPSWTCDRTCCRNSDSVLSVPPPSRGRAKPKRRTSCGKWPCVHRSNTAGRILRDERSPSAPKMTTVARVEDGMSRNSRDLSVDGVSDSSSESEFSRGAPSSTDPGVCTAACATARTAACPDARVVACIDAVLCRGPYEAARSRQGRGVRAPRALCSSEASPCARTNATCDAGS
eukprot:6193269-Pleurochrysis_carterae.AAC.2